MIVRDATPSDLPALLQLLDEDVIRERAEHHGDLTPYATGLDEILASDHLTCLVVEDGDDLVATVQVAWLRRLMYAGGLVCQLESMRTSSSRRGEGVGTLLVEHVVAEARRRDCARVELTTNAQRRDAHRFYERLGFVPSHIGMKLYLEGDAS